ncbi:MAG: hypothetical protein COA70_03435 [Planctomycetota bacterium]|nr:MAG: hypothetical protein COA70_03435 [Planctomycetota bacterium]
MDEGAALLLQLGVLVLLGAICAAIAKNRGRNALGWFVIGMIGGCIGLILVLVLPDLKKEGEGKDREKRLQAKLREELAQERMKNQAFRGHATHRLDAHDEQLGVDTRTSAGGTLPPPPVPEELEEGIPSVGWHIVLPGLESEGPLSLIEMKSRLQKDEVSDKTLVWHESLEDWVQVAASPLHVFLP